MSSHEAEEVLPMPLDIVQASMGFSLDIGGSMAKIIYRSNKDYKDGVPFDLSEKESQMGKVHAVQFPRDDVDTYVTFLRENCDIRKGETLYGTGIGGSQYKERLESLGVTYKMVPEFDCFARSLNTLLDKFPKEQWLVELNEEGLRMGLKHLKILDVFQSMTAGRPIMTEDEFQNIYVSQVEAYVERCHKERKFLEGAPYPYLMVMCGSAFGFIQVNADGSCELLDASMMSGRFFLGMATALSGGEKDYNKFIEMANNFDGSTADLCGSDFKSKGQADDHYTKIDADSRIFPFGKIHDVPLDQVKKEDMVSSLLQTMCENVALIAFNVARRFGLKHAYFCGGFVSQEIARRYITMGMAWRSLSVPREERVHCDFVSKSGFLGSVGAFLTAESEQKK